MGNTMKSVLLTSVALSLSVPVAAAQEDAETEVRSLDTVVVTAQRKEERLRDVPIAVSAFGAAQLEDLQIEELVDLSASVPNLQLKPVTASATAVQLHMRGASIQNPGFNTSESPVGIYVDDVYFGRLAASNLELNDIERIEVLRGPQGTLYGRNTMAGAIKFVSRTPDDDAWFRASLGYGSFDTSKLTASVGGPIVEGTLAGSASIVSHKRAEGWLDNPVTGSEPGEFDNFAGRLKLHYYGTEGLSIKLNAMLSESENDGTTSVPYAPFAGPGSVPGMPISGFYSTLAPRDSFGDGDQSAVSLDIGYDINENVSFRSITAYSETNDAFGFDLAGGGVDVGAPGFPFYVGGLFISSESENEALSQEFQLLGTSFGGALDWIAGAYFLKEEGSQIYIGDLSPFFGFREDGQQETNSASIFAEGTFHVNDSLSLIGGVRFTQDEKEYDLMCTDLATAGPGCFPGSGASISLEEDFEEPSLKLGFRWKLDEENMVYGTFAEGFQAGGFQTLCFGNLVCAGNIYQPQTVQNFELGYKGAFFQNRLRLDANVFQAQYDDIQQTLVTAAGFPVANVGEVDVTGIELQANWVATDFLSFFANLGTLDSEYGTLNPAALTAPSNDLPAAPAYSYQVGFNLDGNLTNEIGWKIGADYGYNDDHFSETTNALPIDSYGTLNGIVAVDFQDGKYKLALTGRNLTDEEIIVSGLVTPGFSNTRFVNPPREWMLTFSVDY